MQRLLLLLVQVFYVLKNCDKIDIALLNRTTSTTGAQETQVSLCIKIVLCNLSEIRKPRCQQCILHPPNNIKPGPPSQQPPVTHMHTQQSVAVNRWTMEVSTSSKSSKYRFNSPQGLENSTANERKWPVSLLSFE